MIIVKEKTIMCSRGDTFITLFYVKGLVLTENDRAVFTVKKDIEGRQTLLSLPCGIDEFIAECNRHGYNCGIYASLDWLENRIYTNLLPEYAPIWCAQWAHSCDWSGAKMWQFTDRLKVGNRWFDGNWYLE